LHAHLASIRKEKSGTWRVQVRRRLPTEGLQARRHPLRQTRSQLLVRRRPGRLAPSRGNGHPCGAANSLHIGPRRCTP